MTALLALDPRDPEEGETRPDAPWPGWTGVRRGPDHTQHAGRMKDRERTDDQ